MKIKFLISLTLIILLFSSFVFAERYVNYEFKEGFIDAGNLIPTSNPVTNVGVIGFVCLDDTCTTLGNKIFDYNTGSNDYIQLVYPTQLQSYGYAIYSYKDDYITFEDYSDFYGPDTTPVGPYTNYLTKKQNCQAIISSLQITGNTIIGNPVTIDTNIDSPTVKGTVLGAIPPELQSYYQTQIQVDLEIYDILNNLIYTDTQIPSVNPSSTNNIVFSWTPTAYGDYRAVIKTITPDAKCDSYIEETSETLFTIANQPPVVSDIPDQIIDEGSSFTQINLDDYVTDPDNLDSEITWIYSGNTELIIDITDRIATITIPDIDWYGSEIITFRATDPQGLYNEDSATFTVNSINDAPIANNIITNTDEDTEIIIILDYNDVDIGDQAETCSVTNVLEGSITQPCICASGICTVGLTPLLNSVFDMTADYTVNDGDIDSNIASITITINPIDDPAQWQTLSDQSIDEDSPDNTIVYLDLLLQCTDPDDPINMQVTSTHANYDLSFSGNDLIVTNLLTNYNGIELVDLDCNGIPNSFTFTVNSINDLPVALAGPDRTIVAGILETFDGSSSYDVDGTIVSYEWDFDASDGIQVDATGPIVQNSFPLGTYIVTLTITDNDVAIGTDTLTVISNGVPTAVIAGGPDIYGYVGQPIIFDGTLSTDDGTIVSYDWDFGDTNTSSGIMVSHIYDSEADYTVTLTVTDDDTLTDTVTATAHITILSVNNPPTITSTPITTAVINQEYIYDVDATDPDGDTLNYSLTNFPAGMIIDNNTGLINWTPTNLGIYNVAILVDDLNGGSDTQIFNIEVLSEPKIEVEKKHLFSVGSISIPSNTYYSGDTISGFMQLRNIGQKKEKNIAVYASILDLGVETIITQNLKLGSRENKWLPFELDLPYNLDQEEYLLRIEISNTHYTEVRYIPIYIRNKYYLNF